MKETRLHTQNSIFSYEVTRSGDTSKKTVYTSRKPVTETRKNKKYIKVRFEKSAPAVYKGGMVPTNILEAKDKFLKCGIDPVFLLNGNELEVERLINHNSGKINFHLFNEAKRIIDSICFKYSTLDSFIKVMYGEVITLETAVQKVNNYIARHNLQNDIEVIWCNELTCSAQMNSVGPEPRLNRPQERKYILLIKNSTENSFMRECGIECLMDHEIGTHFFRSYNDGYQVWYADRDRYGLTQPKTYDGMKTEEGFACLNTILSARTKCLCMPALLYYASCLAEYLTFKELFEHLRQYIASDEQRWKHCMRVKRGLKNVNTVGGYGKDQRYFEGAVEILRNLNSIDLKILISGKVLWTETKRLSNIARKDILRLPHFMQDMDKYVKMLKSIAHENGIHIYEHEEVKPKLQRENQVAMIRSLSKTPIARGKQARTSKIPFITKKKNDTACNDICGCHLFTQYSLQDTPPTGNSQEASIVPIVLEINMHHPIGMLAV